MSNGGYTTSTPGSSLPGGPEVSFAEPKWYAFFRIGIRKQWHAETQARANSKKVLAQFFIPNVSPWVNHQTLPTGFGKAEVVSLFDVGSHEHGLDCMGEELIPFGFRGG